MKTSNRCYDVVIVGGGIIGGTLALLLAKKKFHTLIVEPTVCTLEDHNPFPDVRISALSCTSIALLREIQVWKYIEERFHVPYRRLETWEWPSSLVVFDSDSLRLPELGFIIENGRLKQALWQAFCKCDFLTVNYPSSLQAMRYEDKQWRLRLNDGSIIKSRILIGADGSQSLVRKQANITVSGWQYGQACLLMSIKIQDNQQDVTWQAFYPSGPRAFLPLYDSWASLIWYDDIRYIRSLEKLSLKDLAKEVQSAFPARLGKFTLYKAVSFSLMRQHAHVYVKHGLALIGDAAHTINPLAGQGANLGFRDVEVLAQVLTEARRCDEPWETLKVLKRYQHRRRKDNLIMQAGMDAIYMIFSNHFFPLMLARNFSIMFVQHVNVVKIRILRYALGLSKSIFE